MPQLLDRDAWKAIQKIADQLEPELRQNFLAAIAELRDRINIDALVRALSEGRLSSVALAAGKLPADLTSAVQVVNHAFAVVGAKAAAQLSDALDFRIRFDVVNPFAVKAAETNAARLVTAITSETEAAIRAVIVRAFRDGIAPRDVAVLLRPLIGLTERQALAVINYREMLVGSGLTPARVQVLVERYAARLLRQRAVTIARTEIISASTQGQLALWRQAQRDEQLTKTATKVWIVTPDDRLCPSCASIDGVEILVRDRFETPYGLIAGPPMHPKCRCALGIGRP